MSKDVTLCVPCYNASKYLDRVIPSILKQTHEINEVIFVDDGSTDNTVAIIKRYAENSRFPIKIICHKQNKGLGATRNTAINNGRSYFIASIDSDVMLEADWLKNLMTLVEDNQIAGAGGELIESYKCGMANNFRNSYMRQSWGEEERDVRFLFGANHLYKKHLLVQVGLYDERCRRAGDDTEIAKDIARLNYRLRYTPKAKCWHLREDCLKSILNTLWRWSHPYDMFPRKSKFKKLLLTIYKVDVKSTIVSMVRPRYGFCFSNLIVLFIFIFYSLYKDIFSFLSWIEPDS